MMNIGNILLAWGIINRTQLDAAVEEQTKTAPPTKKLGELVVGMGYATSQQVQLCLEKQEVLRSGHAPVDDIETVADYATATIRRTSEELEKLSEDIVKRDKELWGDE